MLDSCFYQNGLPDFETFSKLLHIYSIVGFVLLIFSLFIIFKSPPAKETYLYKCLTLVQYITLFLISNIWFMAKMCMDCKMGLLYLEGSLLGRFLNLGQVFTILVFLVGIYLSCLQITFVLRLQAIAHKNHIIHKQRIVYGYIIFFFSYVVIFQPTLFSVGYVVDIEAEGNPLKTLDDRERNFMIVRRVVWYPLKNKKTSIFIASVLVSISYTVMFLVLSSKEIVSQIKERESISYSTNLTHHRKVLRTLIIQTTGTALIMIPSSFSLALQILISFSKCVTQVAVCSFGLCFSANAILLLSLNSTYRQTMRRIFFEKKNLQVIRISNSRSLPTQKVPSKPYSSGRLWN